MVKKGAYIFLIILSLIIVVILSTKCYYITNLLTEETSKLKSLPKVKNDAFVQFKYIDVLNLINLSDNLKIENIDKSKTSNTINIKLSFSGTEEEFNRILEQIKEKENLKDINTISLNKIKDGIVKVEIDAEFLSIRKV